MVESRDELFDSKWFRGLVVAALLSGAGGSISALNKDDSDRYKAAEARADFAIRDTSLARGAARLTALELALSTHLQHSATYTQIILDLKKRFEETPHPPVRVEVALQDLETRIRALERHE